MIKDASQRTVLIMRISNINWNSMLIESQSSFKGPLQEEAHSLEQSSHRLEIFAKVPLGQFSRH